MPPPAAGAADSAPAKRDASEKPLRPGDGGEVFADGFGESELEGVGDEGVADGDLEEIGDGGDEGGEIGEVEVVAGVDAESGGRGGAGGGGVGLDGGGVALGEVGGVGFGVEFDAVGAHLGGEGHGIGDRVHEEADAAAEGFELGDDGAEAVGIFAEVPAVVAGGGFGGVGDEGALGGADLFGVVHVVDEGVSFDVEFAGGVGFDEGGEFMHVGGPDVALVGAGVDGDSGGAGVEAEPGGMGDAGDADGAGVAQGGDFVDVDAEVGHGGDGSSRVQGFKGSRPGGGNVKLRGVGWGAYSLSWFPVNMRCYAAREKRWG
jgi:hypothetical protein